MQRSATPDCRGRAPSLQEPEVKGAHRRPRRGAPGDGGDGGREVDRDKHLSPARHPRLHLMLLFSTLPLLSHFFFFFFIIFCLFFLCLLVFSRTSLSPPPSTTSTPTLLILGAVHECRYVAFRTSRILRCYASFWFS